MKVSLHCQKVPSWVVPRLTAAGVAWLKIVNPGSGPQPFAGNICIRQWTDNIDAQYLGQRGSGGAQFVRDILYPLWQQCPWATCIETANEPDCNSNSGLEQLRLYSLGAMRQAEALGMPPLCILNLPEGNPSGDDAAARWKLAQLAEAVKWAADHGHYVGLHAYWRPGIEGPTGRYHGLGRVIWTVEQWAGMGVDVSKLKVLVNECGIDGGIAGGTPYRGWRSLSDPATYAAQIVELERAARQYPWLGACLLFTAGHESPWADFDIDETLWARIAAGVAALPAETPSAPTTVYGPDPAVKYWHSDRHGYAPQYIIIHDTEGPASAALAWWSSPNNPHKSSAHDLVRSDGTVEHCIPYKYAAHHCGGSTIPGVPSGSVDGTSIVNLVSIGIELEYPAAPASPPWPEAQLATATRLVATLAHQYGIPRDHILRHLDVDPQNRSDPRNFDWAMFLARVAEERMKVAEQEIRNAAWVALDIPYNPNAAFPRYAREHNLGNPVTREMDANGYRLQGYAGGILYAKIGDWSNVAHIAW